MKENLTFIAVVLDRSGSMEGLREDTIGGFNSFLSEQKRCPGEALFTLVQFDNFYEIHADCLKIGDVRELTRETYVPRGGTALYDAIGRTIDSVGAKLAAMPEVERPSKVLIMIQTDGHENASHAYTRAQVANMIKHQREKYAWDFVFVGASEQAVADAVALGVAAEWTAQYSADAVGTAAVLRSIGTSTTSYRNGTLTARNGFFNP